MGDFEVEDWAVEKEADLLNTSLFSGSLPKKKKKKSLSEVDKPESHFSVLDDKASPKKLSGQKRKLSEVSENQDGQTDSQQLPKKKKHKKKHEINMNNIDERSTGTSSDKGDIHSMVQLTSKKRKKQKHDRENHTDKKQPVTPLVSSIMDNERNNSKVSVSQSGDEDSQTVKKRKRKKKKKNSSKKNKYAHLGRKSDSDRKDDNVNSDKKNVLHLNNSEKPVHMSSVSESESKTFTLSSPEKVDSTDVDHKRQSEFKEKKQKRKKKKHKDEEPAESEVLENIHHTEKESTHITPKKAKFNIHTLGKILEQKTETSSDHKTKKELNSRVKTSKVHKREKQLDSIVKTSKDQTTKESDSYLKSASVEDNKQKTKQKMKAEESDYGIDNEDEPPTSLLERMKNKLNSARFRYLNEQLYKQTGRESLKMFKGDEEAFKVYHEGFSSQVAKWPVNPVDLIINQIQDKPPNTRIADFGCGDAKIARSLKNKVHSFDLIPINKHVTVCDIAKVPLKNESVDIAVFCLSLMGTNMCDYLKEANRVLRRGGTLKIAEVTSRFKSLPKFIKGLEKLGFKLINQETDNKMFWMFDFKKKGPVVTASEIDIHLDPCTYKKR